MATPMTVLELTRAVGDLDITNAPAVEGDAAGGPPFTFPNDGMTFLACLGDGGGTTITFTGYADEFGRVASVLTFVVGNGLTALVGPFDPHLWNDTDGNVNFTLGAYTAGDIYEAVRITNTGTNGV